PLVNELINQPDHESTVIQTFSNPNNASHPGKPQIIDDRYRISGQLRAGTVGVACLATDLDLEEKIAVKVIQKDAFQNIEGLNIKEEIRLARKITHRNIVRTYDFGSVENTLYITMEYVQGYDLGRMISKKGALDLNI